MLVRATQRGFYKSLRSPDEVFEVPDHLYAASWMTKVPTVAGKPVVSLNVPSAGGVQPTAVKSLNVPTPAEPILGLLKKDSPPSPAAPFAPRPRFPLFGDETRTGDKLP